MGSQAKSAPRSGSAGQGKTKVHLIISGLLQPSPCSPSFILPSLVILTLLSHEGHGVRTGGASSAETRDVRCRRPNSYAFGWYEGHGLHRKRKGRGKTHLVSTGCRHDGRRQIALQNTVSHTNVSTQSERKVRRSMCLAPLRFPQVRLATRKREYKTTVLGERHHFGEIFMLLPEHVPFRGLARVRT